MDRLYYQELTVGPGLGGTTYDIVSWPLEDNQLKEITIQVPDGHCGLTGVRILRAQQQIVPFANNTYLVSNDRTFTYTFDDEISSSGLQIMGLNSDIFSHTFYCTALVTNLPLPGEEPEAEVTPLPDVTSAYVPEDDSFDVNSILASAPDLATTPVTEQSPPSLPVPAAPVKGIPAPVRNPRVPRPVKLRGKAKV